MNFFFYKLLQDYVHQGHKKQKAVLRAEYALLAEKKSSPRVLELACGGGGFADLFKQSCYTGIDLSAERIAIARDKYPGYTFKVFDVDQSGFVQLVRSADLIYCHGLLHHLNDEQCGSLLRTICEHAGSPAVFIAFEPVLPLLRRNPLGYLLSKLDEGRFIRRPQEYAGFFQGRSLEIKKISFFPRWPQTMRAYILRF